MFELTVYNALLDFIFYSIGGWIYESTYESIRAKTFINRGFLTGPCIPIYGLGAVAIYGILTPFAHNYFLIFLLGMILATVLEYLTALLLENLFHTQWWTYDYFRFNFQGRIALIPSLFWGVLAVLDFALLQPFVGRIIYGIPVPTGRILILVFYGLLLVDLVFTTISTFSFTKALGNLYDLFSQNRYSEKLIQFLNRYDYKRILQAFPNMRFLENRKNPFNPTYISVRKFVKGIRKRNRSLTQLIQDIFHR